MITRRVAFLKMKSYNIRVLYAVSFYVVHIRKEYPKK